MPGTVLVLARARFQQQRSSSRQAPPLIPQTLSKRQSQILLRILRSPMQNPLNLSRPCLVALFLFHSGRVDFFGTATASLEQMRSMLLDTSATSSSRKKWLNGNLNQNPVKGDKRKAASLVVDTFKVLYGSGDIMLRVQFDVNNINRMGLQCNCV